MNRAREAAEKICDYCYGLPAISRMRDRTPLVDCKKQITDIIESTCIAPIVREVKGLSPSGEWLTYNNAVGDVLAIINPTGPDEPPPADEEPRNQKRERNVGDVYTQL